ncbi:MAG TPA: amidohydrolase family protein [Phycisphaerae bacterium]|jgi:guanine deaminase|nr:amidohydrolase family protein [Phycisphaerae bacterium]HOB74068.1 amidohydrolase family protein [Phycisphaerae bacterium]HOJ56490.1 amidohydrolase family protein [Phycisphaerae bacterium]HOL25406.1 amidohydrolase family protein [Phycisphaerae bacterium]HPP22082.1 amidohydrolase family protein [Phycisphaerae bacterium]
MRTLYGTLLQPRSADDCAVTPKMAVRIGPDGRISEVCQRPATGRDVCGDEQCWILPGFIDAHLHLPQWDRRGIDGLSLLDWHEQVVYPAEARFEDPAVAERLTEDFVTHMIANGTTTVAAFGSPYAEATDRAFTVFARRGVRAIHGMMLNDLHCPPELRQDADKALDASRDLAARWHNAEGGRLSYAFSPRTPVSCSERMMRGAAALAGMLKCYVQTHLAESLALTRAARESFPDRVDEVDIFAEMGLLSQRTLLGHGVFLNQQQRHQVAKTRTTVVHCPTANLFLEAGVMDYVAHRSAGIRIALGSSLAGGHDPFMPRVAIECLQTAKGLKMHAVPRRTYAVPTPAEAWWLLTRGAAMSLELDHKIGSIEPGFEADCLVVRPEPWIAELPPERQVSALLYTLGPEQIEHVFIAGHRVGP